jgi:hypothetical protein
MLGIITEWKGGLGQIFHRSEELIRRMEALLECFGVWKFHGPLVCLTRWMLREL